MTPEQIKYFQTFGFFLFKQLLSPEEMASLSKAFDSAMENARDGAPKPAPGQKRQQIIPFFDYNPEAFYPLLDTAPEDLPGQYPLVNEPGDVLFMNHKVQHAALSDKPWRRAIHINAVQNTTPEKNQEHFTWLTEFLAGETKHWGRFYSDQLIRTAGPCRKKMLDRAVALGFGNTGPITQLQELK